MIVIALTSWKKRINQVEKVVRSIFSNTLSPDRVYLTLSSDEFPEKEKELPEGLVKLCDEFPFIINWVKENTKSMKKIFPILQYLDDDDIIIDADDDILFPNDLIEFRMKDFEANGRKCAITSGLHHSVGFDGKMYTVQAVSLFQKKMLRNWKRFVTETVIKTYNDDRTYLYLLWLNGYRDMPCTKWNVKELMEKYDQHLDGGMLKNHTHLIGRTYDRIIWVEFMKNEKIDINKSFGVWK